MSSFCVPSNAEPTAVNVSNCSFAYTGCTEINQAVYICKSCFPDNDSYGFCIGCAGVCHEDHDVEFVSYDEFYCECGSNGCRLFQQSIPYSNLSSILPDLHNLQQQWKAYQPTFSSHSIENLNVDSLKKQIKLLTHKSKETFWISSSDTPRCELENLALQIGNYHLEQQFRGHESYEQITSITGYEWWMQLKQFTPSESERTTGVDLHYDKDEELAEKYGVGVFPFISTVTYLTANASYNHPTVIFDATAADDIGTPITDCFISIPKPGKHVAFDGKLLHGAPAELLFFSTVNGSNQNEEDEGLRVTFLVNVWINHKPAAINPLDIGLVNELNQLSENSNIKYSIAPSSVHSKFVEVTKNDVLNEEVGGWLIIPFVSNEAEWEKAADEAGLDMRMWLPFVKIESFHNSQKFKKIGQNSSEFPLGTYHIQYKTEDISATLEYECGSDEDDEI